MSIRPNLALGALMALVIGFSSSISAAAQQGALLQVSAAAAPLGTALGTALSAPELTSQKGSVDWVLNGDELDVLAAMLSDDRQALPNLRAGALALIVPAAGPNSTADDRDRSLQADFPPASAVTDRLKQFQGKAAFDTSLHYLCSGKIYAPMYPSGTGWNNQASDGCSPSGAINTAQTATLPIGFTPGPNIDPILPCGGSIANIQTMTIVGSGNMPSGGFTNAVAFAGQSSVHGGRRW